MRMIRNFGYKGGSWRHTKKGPPYRKLCGSVRYLGADYLDWLAAQPKYGDVMQGWGFWFSAPRVTLVLLTIRQERFRLSGI